MDAVAREAHLKSILDTVPDGESYIARDVWFENLDRPTWGLSSQAISAVGIGLALTIGLFIRPI